MNKKKEIHLKSSDLRNLAIAIFLPFAIMFIIEHFGKFEYVGNTAGNMEDIRVTSLIFTTPLGTKYYQDTSNEKLGYTRQSNGVWKINGSYFQKLPYYLLGLYYDIIYPIIFSVILLLLFFIFRKYSIKISP